MNDNDRWSCFSYPRFSSNFSDYSLAAYPSYTSKIRQRHFSVGSYYDYKTTVVSVHPIHPVYFLGSSTLSPINRPSSSAMINEVHYFPRPTSGVEMIHSLSSPFATSHIETTNSRPATISPRKINETLVEMENQIVEEKKTVKKKKNKHHLTSVFLLFL